MSDKIKRAVIITIAKNNERRCSIICKFLRIDVSGPFCLLYGRLSHNADTEIYRRGECISPTVIEG